MTTTILSKLFWLLAAVCLFVLVNFDPPAEHDHHAEEISKVEQSEQNRTQESETPQETQQLPGENFIAAYNRAVETNDLDKKLNAINQALAIAEKENVSNKRYLANLHILAASVHEDRWHIHYAIESLQKAQSIKFNRKVDRWLKQMKKGLAAFDKERNLNQEYVATRDSGPAKSLKGKVLVAYIFIDDGIKTRWTDRNIQRTDAVLSKVEAWNKQQAQNYKIDGIEFINKQFLVNRNPQLKLLSSVSIKSAPQNIEKMVQIVANHLGAKTIGEFINEQVKKAGADQGVVIFHSNFDRRSFARRCGFTHQRIYYENGLKKTENFSTCEDEFVMLMEQVKRNRWDKLHYAQAHEILHLFGADDLYSISNAKNYAVTDIMNFQSRKLKYSEITPITAYAIGWQKNRPIAPFDILDR